jgi:methyltransferase (TIGR00027 family)
VQLRRPRAAPSLTSQAVARVRAGLVRPHSADGDPSMQGRLTADLRTGGGPALHAHMAARTAFVDDAVVAALGAGIPQVVVIGAGYDDRAWRFRTPGVLFFEVDHPTTQADKRHRVERFGGSGDVRFVPVDLVADDIGSALAAAGHNPSGATLFICEGLLVYLDADVITRLLDALRTRAATGSRLVSSLAVHADGVDSARAVEVANGRRADPRTEPWRTILSRRAHLALLADSGWLTIQAADLPSATGGGVTLLVSAAPA